MLEDPDSALFARERAKEIFEDFLFNEREDLLE
jgi:hypothetical protein